MSDNPYAPPSVAVLSPEKQTIWTKELKSARTILIVVGIIQLLLGVPSLTTVREDFDKGIEAEVKKEGPGYVVDQAKVDQLFEDNKALFYALGSIPTALGVFFLGMAALVFKFPVVVTLTSLIVFVLAHVASGILEPAEITHGIPLKIVFVVILSKAYKSARNAKALIAG
jgi:hypothetical protein